MRDIAGKFSCLHPFVPSFSPPRKPLIHNNFAFVLTHPPYYVGERAPTKGAPPPTQGAARRLMEGAA